MRIVTAAALAAAALLAACEKEPDTLVGDPNVVNADADAAAEMNRPTYTPVEVGNGVLEENAAGAENGAADQ